MRAHDDLAGFLSIAIGSLGLFAGIAVAAASDRMRSAAAARAAEVASLPRANPLRWLLVWYGALYAKRWRLILAGAFQFLVGLWFLARGVALVS